MAMSPDQRVRAAIKFRDRRHPDAAKQGLARVSGLLNANKVDRNGKKIEGSDRTTIHWRLPELALPELLKLSFLPESQCARVLLMFGRILESLWHPWLTVRRPQRHKLFRDCVEGLRARRTDGVSERPPVPDTAHSEVPQSILSRHAAGPREEPGSQTRTELHSRAPKSNLKSDISRKREER